jgi:hypothetical protein
VRIKSQKDFYAGVMFVATGVVFALGATQYNFGSSARPGPGYFPFGLGVLLALLGALVLFKALTIESEGGDPVGSFAWRPLLFIVLAIVACAVTLPRLGMVVALPLQIAVSAWAGDEFRWQEVAVMSAVMVVASWLTFVKGLHLTIPLWPTFLSFAS